MPCQLIAYKTGGVCERLAILAKPCELPCIVVRLLGSKEKKLIFGICAEEEP